MLKSLRVSAYRAFNISYFKSWCATQGISLFRCDEKMVLMWMSIMPLENDEIKTNLKWVNFSRKQTCAFASSWPETYVTTILAWPGIGKYVSCAWIDIQNQMYTKPFGHRKTDVDPLHHFCMWSVLFSDQKSELKSPKHRNFDSSQCNRISQ